MDERLCVCVCVCVYVCVCVCEQTLMCAFRTYFRNTVLTCKAEINSQILNLWLMIKFT